jgi:hypothetical protein
LASLLALFFVIKLDDTPRLSLFTFFMDNLFQDPAVSYWDKKLTEDGEVPSPRMASLITAIFDWYKQGDGTEVIHPHSFNYLLNAFARPDFSSGADTFPTQLINKLATCYYDTFGLTYTVDDSWGTDHRPLLPASSLRLWIMLQLCTAPESTLQSLKTFLGKKNVLDPDTGEEFTYKCIPSECLPELRADMVEFLDDVTEEWVEARTRIMDSWNKFSASQGEGSMSSTNDLKVKTEEPKPNKDDESTTMGSFDPGRTKHLGNMAANAERMLQDAQNPQPVNLPPTTTSNSTPHSSAGIPVAQGNNPTTQGLNEAMKQSEEQLAFTRQHIATQQQQMFQMRLNQMNNYSQMQAAAAMQCSAAQQSNATLFGFATQSWGQW